MAKDLSNAVGEGEAQAIALALDRKERLIIDDLKARRIADEYKIDNTTTLGLIFELLTSKVLPSTDYKRNVKNYASQGWISGEIIQEFMERGKDYE